jgi:hypothetical protein
MKVGGWRLAVGGWRLAEIILRNAKYKKLYALRFIRQALCLML